MESLPENITLKELVAMARNMNCELKVTLEPIPTPFSHEADGSPKD